MANHSALYIPPLFKSGKNDGARLPKVYFSTSWSELRMPLLFMLCLAAFGLSFYPALIFVFFILVNRWRKDRYEFIIMLTLFFGEYGYFGKDDAIISTSDIALVVSAVLWFIYRKPPLLKRILAVILFYAASMLVLASFSLESLSIQFLTIRNYLAIIYIIIPVVCFAGKDFDIHVFFRKIINFSLIISVFYIIDAYIFSGNILIPNTFLWGDAGFSTFYRPAWRPLSFTIFRKYPVGLYLMMLAVYPLARYYKLRWWQWALIIVALFSTQTFTVLTGFVAVYMFLVIKPSKIFAAIFLGILACFALYYIDGLLPVPKTDSIAKESRLRIKSSIDQIIALTDMVDDEDLAMFASGRMAQILPKFELIAHEHKQAVGIGFLHREKSKVNRYIIENEYYVDVEQAEEVATGVEVIAAQIYINMGYIGLTIHTLVFLILYLMVRRLKDSVYVLSLLCINVWVGFGGFAGLAQPHGLLLVSLSIAAVVLSNRLDVWGRDNSRRRLRPSGIEVAPSKAD